MGGHFKSVVDLLARRPLPAAAARQVRRRRRGFAFWRAWRRLARVADGAALPHALASSLVYGWGNEDWSAREEYLAGVVAEAWAARGPVLECGSGLTTLLLGWVAGRAGGEVCSLEHDPVWAERTRAALRRHGLTRARVCHAPLRDYGEFCWYEPPAGVLPREFSLVVCDGPPGDTRGGRYGLLPVLGARLARGCVVLLDDAARPGEAAVLRRWAAEWGASFESAGRAKPYARVFVAGGAR
jgi:Methyltransferase domain